MRGRWEPIRDGYSEMKLKNGNQGREMCPKPAEIVEVRNRERAGHGGKGGVILDMGKRRVVRTE